MLKGVIAPVTTPFTVHGEVDFAAFRRNLTNYAASPLTGCLVAGTTGEGVHLSFDEKIQLLEVAADCLPDDRYVAAGLSAPSLQSGLHQLEQLQKRHLDAVLVSVPGYYKTRMTDAALDSFYRTIADNSSVPVLLYNIPQLTGLELSLPLVERLSAHPRIAGIKESSGNLIYLQGVLSRTDRAEFQVISGSAETVALARPLGIDCGILGIGCVVPQMMADLLAVTGRDTFAPAQAKMFDLASVIVRGLGVPGVKYAMDLCGLDGLYCRQPLMPLTEDEKARVRTVLKRAGCL
jgi:4-hydroxy-2-oxoglutarate aldolase